jgi:hypothetical protein
MRLRSVSSVVVGHFNPHIIAPDWLVREGIVPQADTQVSVSVGEAVTGFQLQFSTGHFSWLVDNSRLMIMANIFDDTSRLAAEVLSRLHHTPVRAVGNNFTYASGISEWRGQLPAFPHFQLDAPEAIKLQFSLNRGSGAILRFAIDRSAQEVSIELNYHRVVEGVQGARAAIANFDRDYQDSRVVIERGFGQEVLD